MDSITTLIVEDEPMLAEILVDTIKQLVANWTNSLPKIVAAARGTDVETRELIKDVLKAIPASAAKVAVGELRNDKDGDA